MVDPKTTYDYGAGVLEIDLDGEVTGLHLTGEQFDSVVKQLVEICTAEVADYNSGYDVGYAEAVNETDDRYDEGFVDGYDEAENDRESIWDDGYEAGYDDGHRDGYDEAHKEIVSSKGDEDDE